MVVFPRFSAVLPPAQRFYAGHRQIAVTIRLRTRTVLQVLERRSRGKGNQGERRLPASLRLGNLCTTCGAFACGRRFACPVRLFVDSAPGITYSGVLARCCAWGLCVFTRTRLVETLEGAAGAGMAAAGCECLAPIQRSRGPKGHTRNPHPNRFVWKWEK